MQSIAAAIFVDILGFADLVEENDDAVSYLDAFRGPDRDGPLSTLEVRYLAFQAVLDNAVDRKIQNRDLRAIVFSDSAFIIFEEDEFTSNTAGDVGHALHFASLLMREMLAAGVPVRMGIGSGSFRGLRFRSDGDPGRSVSIHAAQFLGTAIVRAHRAESCGLPGMRIFLHPTIPLDALRGNEDRLLPISSDSSRLRTPVAHELIYLHRPGDKGWWAWNNEPVKPSTTNWKMLQGIFGMRDRAPPSRVYHYAETLASIERARQHLRLPMITESDP